MMRVILSLTFSAALLAGCSGGSNNHGDTAPVVSNALCPSTLDYSTTWIGGSGSGEVVKVQLDTTRMTWQITYVESVVPVAKGTAEPSRAGQVMSGTLSHETGLPTQSLNDCTFRLNGADVTATSATGADTFDDNSSSPARVFVGQGIMGGVLPGKEVQYNGISVPVVGTIAPIPDITFRYFPFLAFSQVDTSLSALVAQSPYTQLGFSVTMTQNFATAPINAKWVFKSDGSYTKCDSTGQNAGKCVSSNTQVSGSPVNEPFVQSTDGSGAFESDNYQGQLAPYKMPALAALVYPNNTAAGKAFMIVGKVRGGDVPLLIRRGTVNIPTIFGGTSSTTNVDDEVGISLMQPQANVAAGSVNGEYITVDSSLNATAQYPGGNDNQFNYRAILVTGTGATLIDPFNPSSAATATALTIGYTSTATPGALSVSQGASAPTGTMIFGSGAVAYLDQSNPNVPYFTAGAFVQ
jgi:hypothetical protein